MRKGSVARSNGVTINLAPEKEYSRIIINNAGVFVLIVENRGIRYLNS